MTSCPCLLRVRACASACDEAADLKKVLDRQMAEGNKFVAAP